NFPIRGRKGDKDRKFSVPRAEKSITEALARRCPNRHELSMAEGQSPDNARRDGERTGRRSNVAQLESNIIVHVPLDPFEFRRKRFSAVLQTQDLIRE